MGEEESDCVVESVTDGSAASVPMKLMPFPPCDCAGETDGVDVACADSTAVGTRVSIAVTDGSAIDPCSL